MTTLIKQDYFHADDTLRRFFMHTADIHVLLMYDGIRPTKTSLRKKISGLFSVCSETFWAPVFNGSTLSVSYF